MSKLIPIGQVSFILWNSSNFTLSIECLLKANQLHAKRQMSNVPQIHGHRINRTIWQWCVLRWAIANCEHKDDMNAVASISSYWKSHWARRTHSLNKENFVRCCSLHSHWIGKFVLPKRLESFVFSFWIKCVKHISQLNERRIWILWNDWNIMFDYFQFNFQRSIWYSWLNAVLENWFFHSTLVPDIFNSIRCCIYWLKKCVFACKFLVIKFLELIRHT